MNNHDWAPQAPQAPQPKRSRPWYHWVGMGCGVIIAINLVTCAGCAGLMAVGNDRFEDKVQEQKDSGR